MAAKKTTPKSAGKKPAASASKKKAAAAKPAKAPAVKKAAKGKVASKASPKAASGKPSKKAAPTKQAPKQSAKKAVAPAKKAAPAPKKASAKTAPSKKAPAQKAPVKKAASSKKAAVPAKKAAASAKNAATKPAPKSTPQTTKTAVKGVPLKPAPQKAAPSKPIAKSIAETPIPKPTPAKAPAPKFSTVTVNTPDTPSQPIGGTHTVAFVEKQKQRLLDLRDELVDAMTGTTRDTIRNAPEGSEASGSGMHQGDAGSDAYDRDFALSVLAKEQDALYEIEQALQRIKKGTYGVCEMSARKIPTARLEAIPFARLTVECQAQWEKEYGNRRFRPSNEVGFSGGNYSDDEDSDAVSLDEDDD